MRDFSWKFVITIMIFALPGCESLKVMSVPEETGTQGGDVTLHVLGGSGNDSASSEVKNYIDNLPESVNDGCLSKKTQDSGSNKSFVGPTAIPLIMAGVSIAYNQAADAFKDAMLAKISRFQQSYEGQINVPKLIPTTDKSPLRCVELKRSITGDDGKKTIASHIVLGFKDVNSTALEIRPVYVRFNRFAASTQPDSKGNAVDVAVTLGIVTLASDGGEPELRRYEQNLKFRTVRLGQDHDVSSVAPTAIFPRLPDRPATIVMAVTETGKGFKEFEGFEKAFETNREIIGVALGNAIETRLNAIAANSN